MLFSELATSTCIPVIRPPAKPAHWEPVGEVYFYLFVSWHKEYVSPLQEIETNGTTFELLLITKLNITIS